MQFMRLDPEAKTRARARDSKEHVTTVEIGGIPNGSARRAKEERRRKKESIKEIATERGARDQFGRLTERMHKETGRGINQRRRSRGATERR
jgi:hypothetical protein